MYPAITFKMYREVTMNIDLNGINFSTNNVLNPKLMIKIVELLFYLLS